VIAPIFSVRRRCNFGKLLAGRDEGLLEAIDFRRQFGIRNGAARACGVRFSQHDDASLRHAGRDGDAMECFFARCLVCGHLT